MPFSKNQIRTIYLLPHAHTDIGYSHDPVVALELHDRFLDCAITLCEQTRGHEEFALEDDFFWQFAVEFDDFVLVLGEGDCDDLEGAFFLRPVNL